LYKKLNLSVEGKDILIKNVSLQNFGDHNAFAFN